ncbi:hypothetical protein AVL50_19185 [Flammeovirga sp. SJP92]|nr:hypothetical protein AVL50_19185 [Flammeovirga sp. SJP92]
MRTITIKHEDFKHFLIEQLKNKSLLIRLYSALQIIISILFIAQVVYDFIQLFRTNENEHLISFLFVIPLIPLLIIIHELLHGLGYKIVGAKSVYFGMELKKFMFYAGSDRERIGGRKFLFIILLPFVVISLGLLLYLILDFSHYRLILFLSFFHILSCSGDSALLNFIFINGIDCVETEDFRAEQKTNYYIKMGSES